MIRKAGITASTPDVRAEPPDRRENDAGDRCERGAEREYEEPQAADVDAERTNHLAVVRARFHARAVGGLLQEQPRRAP